MAQEWCVAYGVLDDDEAIKVDKIICTRKGTKPSQLIKKATTSATSSSSSSSSSSSTSAVSKDKVKKEPSNKKYKYADDIIMDTGKIIISNIVSTFCMFKNCLSFLNFV